MQGVEERLAVGRVQAGGRFVEHIDDTKQVGRKLRRQPQALQFARRTGRRRPIE